MKVTHHPKVPPTTDPYEDDCCGSHAGESIEIELKDGITLHVKQSDSGIGSSWRVTATHEQAPVPKTQFYTFVGDDGEFIVGASFIK